VEEGGGDGEGEEVGEENGKELFGGPEVTPVVQLNEVPKQTGEEEENSVFTGGCGGSYSCWVLMAVPLSAFP